MSLKVWLPLNGDLHNQGCSDVRVVNNGATIDNAGKIGKCYSFDGSNDYLQTSNFNPSKWPEFSITFWCYPTVTFNNLFLIRGSNAHRFRIASDGVSFRDTNNSTLRTVGLNATIPIDTWTHLTCIYNRGKISIYINGLITVNNTSYYRNNSTFLSDLNEIRIARYTTTSTSKYYSGKLNDIRIYNHALSPAEVKEIAQGLILHYKLDDITNGIIQDSSGYNNNGTIIGTPTISTDTPRYNHSLYLNATNTNNHIDGGQLPSTIQTISFWHKNAGSATAYVVFVEPSSGLMFGPVNTYAVVQTGTSSKTCYQISSPYYTNGEWNHIVVQKDGSTYKLWTNGVQRGSNGSNYYRHDGSNLWLFKRNYNNNYTTNSYISDFRAYTTLLSESDIKQLYEVGAKIDNKQNLHTYEFNENDYNKLTKTGIFKNYAIEPYKTLPDGSYWKLMLFHYVNNGKNLFTSSNATYNNGFGLYSRLRDIANYTYNNGYEYYVIQDGKEFRWTQTSSPIAASITGLTTVSGYNNPVNGLAKRSSLTQTYIGYDSWWGACGCWTSYSTGGKTGIPGFGSHDGNGICTNYLALYTRIEKPKIEIANENIYAESLIEF